MRSVLSVLFISLWSMLGLFAQPTEAVNAVDAKNLKQGAWTKIWPNGKTRYTGQFKDDVPVGTFSYYNEDGQLTSIQDFAPGMVGRARHFHPNGTLMAVGKYVDQRKDSTWNYYGDDGKLRKVERYRAGTLHGEQISYYPDGTVAEREERVGGELHGANKSWFDNGILKSEATYVHGEPEGKMLFYYPSGKKEIEGLMVNGARDGAWFYFNKDGSLQLQVLYAKGELVKEKKENGLFIEYYDDEQVKSEVTYKKGKREGRFVEYHDNGTWSVKPMPADPIMGTRSDMERELKGQTKKREGTYVNDLLNGDVKVRRGRVSR
ncbi:MAG: toxin-antitoxin system YwqK family antitoxin [Flavobacteriales bacterium]|nr:toxin-antitoxin system YwqK family antitoxin [Flavobacteriales bacterium]